MWQTILVYGSIGVAVVVSSFLLWRALRSPDSCTGCSDCPLARNCNKSGNV
ncbi:MAG: hypothetical protein NC038_08585 [Paludibacter sp.]|nr:hypothetical protein [Bacteroidales bacterium]MCM1069992.1 hypothetical protein [Prevotella sp.]MCM1354730.1 hypothetical protein [Bacteroides sp.]MCM1443596.1 hypothetical protein [Muribaculum sp.]MCM1482671.1 hypothetical protein [Paludibacter sp.]